MARPGFATSVFDPSTGRLHERWCYILQGVSDARAVSVLAFAFIRGVDLLCGPAPLQLELDAGYSSGAESPEGSAQKWSNAGRVVVSGR